MNHPMKITAIDGSVKDRAHTGGNCSITGGFWMDWGPEELRGGYLYGDFCSGSIWILKEENGQWSQNYIAQAAG